MDLHYLEIFNAVAKYTSYKKAAEILHISQPALSIQIKKLENQINAKLFYKVGNKMYLSDCGIKLYSYTKRIFAIVEEMESAILNDTETIGGMINIGGSNTPGTYILPLAIGEFRKRYPEVIVNLHVANTSAIMMLVENAALDIAVNGGNYNYNSNIYSEKLLDDRLVIVAWPGHKLCTKEYVNKEDLAKEYFVVHETTSQLYTSFKFFIEKYNIPENISMYLGSIDALKHAVYAELGISIMPYYAVKSEIEMGLLKELRISSEILDYPYNLIYNKNKSISYTTRKFVELLKELYQEKS
jgi:DNA-binding transcriptional LysR family regulator